MEETIIIRGHHLLCMQGFQGYGYSEGFVDNMSGIIDRIKSTPNILVEIVTRCDCICQYCPHNAGGYCSKEPGSREEIKRMDEEVLKRLGMDEGTRVSAGELLDLVKDKLRRISDVKGICGECSWKEKCRWYISRERD